MPTKRKHKSKAKPAEPRPRPRRGGRRRKQAGPKKDLVTGTLTVEADGSGRVLSESGEAPGVYVPASEIAGLSTGEVITIRLEVGRRGRVRGSFVGRGRRTDDAVVGVIREVQGRVWLDPMPRGPLIAVGAKQRNGAEIGDAVVARITRPGHGRRADQGEVTEVVGDAREPRVQTDLLVRSQNWPMTFSQEALAEADAAPAPNPDRVLKGDRRDLRGVWQVTIDGADARDFDDAVGAAALDDGWRVWVSIADVSHYVRAGSALDADAYERATSVYSPHRVPPMLPERLSNDLCSLRPNVPRLAMTAEMIVKGDGRVTSTKVYRSLIESKHRLTYEEVERRIRKPRPGDDLDNRLIALRDVSRSIRRLRLRRGSIDLDLPEARVIVDGDGNARDIRRRARLEAHRIVEDLMIAANEAVARYFLERKVGSVYRVHEPPDPERLEQLASFVERHGYALDPKKAHKPKVLARLAGELQGSAKGDALQMLMLRSLSQARYADENLGHYGLASTAYLHFTSPIRRYPDLLVHRGLDRLWKKKSALPERSALSDHCSVQERRAMQAERAVLHLMSCQVAEDYVGHVFEAMVVGLIGAGAFVRPKEVYFEGLLPVAALGAASREYIEYVEDEMTFIGRRSGLRIEIGDTLRVRLAAVDTERRRIDFELVDPPKPKRTKRDEKRKREKKARQKDRRARRGK